MGRKIVAGVLVGAVAGFSIVGFAGAAPDNKNSYTIGMVCDHGLGAVTGVSINQNNAGAVNVIDPGHGTYAIKRVLVDGQLAYETPGFAGRDLVTCVPVAVNGEPLPSGSPEVVWGGIFNAQR